MLSPASTPGPSRTPSSVALNILAPPPPLYSQSQQPIILSPTAETTSFSGDHFQQTPIPPTRAKRWATSISANLDWILYLIIGLFIGIPLFYTIGYAMPLHLCTTALCYFAALTLPASWRRFLHPVLVSALLTVVIIYIFGLTKGQTIFTTLKYFKPGLKYLELWEHTTDRDRGLLPGAGDIFSSALDASIVSLALPMYQYRRELKTHFAAIVIPNIAVAVGSLFAYPVVCFAIGISATRSLAFAARSLTLALALPATDNLGGDVSTVSALAIMSGIVGALIGERMLRWMRIPDGEY